MVSVQLLGTDGTRGSINTGITGNGLYIADIGTTPPLNSAGLRFFYTPGFAAFYLFLMKINGGFNLKSCPKLSDAFQMGC